MILLERDWALDRLSELLEEADSGRGRVALIRGEAGIGKTSLVRTFVESLDGAHVMWGACDDLLAPRPLGPIWDMAFDVPELEQALTVDERQAVFRAVLHLVTRAMRPTVIVIEDVHWADEATLDLIKFVGRRIDRTHGLMVLTYRDGEVIGDHPLRVALGDVPHGVVERISLAVLSIDGVRELAGQDADTDSLWKLTGGNPFFVSEALAAGGVPVPVSISEVVNARVQRLSPAARTVVELASVVPSKIELALVEEVLGDSEAGIAECEEAGILALSGQFLRFRHELARRAVESDLPAITRRALNLECLRASESLRLDISRCAHHAREAKDAESILRILPRAARRASELESHAEALATLRALEPYLEMMAPTDLADHYDLWAYEEYLGSDQGLELIQRGIEIRRSLEDPVALANSLLIGSRVAWVGAQRRLATTYAEEAAEAVGAVGGEQLAMSYSVLSQLAMLGGFRDETISWAEKALDLVGDEDSQVRAHALNNLGSIKMMEDPNTGVDELLESRRIAASLNLLHEETRACVNLAWNFLLGYRLDEGAYWIEQAISVVGDAEMPSFESYTHAERAWLHEMRGEWAEAEEAASSVLDLSTSLQTARAAASITLSRLGSRSGASDVDALVTSAVELAESTEEAQRLGPAYAIVAEHSWLGGDVGESRIQRAIEVMEWCANHGSTAPAGEIGFWLFLQGTIGDLPEYAPEPFQRLASGDWAQAASWWEEHGLPYERAVALSLGDVEARVAALGTLDRLGAAPLAARVRGELLEEGVRGVPKGPQRATRDHPLGLTARQTDVLDLLAEDLTNAEIADRLFISTRTVDHHVSAILAKLGAANRTEAAQKAREALASA